MLLGGLFIAAVIAFVHCLTTPAAAFGRASKRSKTVWLLITGASLLIAFLSLPVQGGGRLMLLSLAAAVAVIVYLSDVRPAVAVYRRRGGGGPRGQGSASPGRPGTW